MEREVVMKIRKLSRGDLIAVFPFSRKYGDLFTAVAFPCPGTGPDLPIEIEDPLKAEFIKYEDSVMVLSSPEFRCLVIDIAFVRDIEAVG